MSRDFSRATVARPEEYGGPDAKTVPGQGSLPAGYSWFLAPARDGCPKGSGESFWHRDEDHTVLGGAASGEKQSKIEAEETGGRERERAAR